VGGLRNWLRVVHPQRASPEPATGAPGCPPPPAPRTRRKSAHAAPSLLPRLAPLQPPGGPSEALLRLVVTSEDGSGQQLAAIDADAADAFRRADTILTWESGADGGEVAISFQEAPGCAQVWQAVCAAYCVTPDAAVASRAASLGLPAGEEEEDMIGDGGGGGGDGGDGSAYAESGGGGGDSGMDVDAADVGLLYQRAGAQVALSRASSLLPISSAAHAMPAASAASSSASSSSSSSSSSSFDTDDELEDAITGVASSGPGTPGDKALLPKPGEIGRGRRRPWGRHTRARPTPFHLLPPLRPSPPRPLPLRRPHLHFGHPRPHGRPGAQRADAHDAGALCAAPQRLLPAPAADGGGGGGGGREGRGGAGRLPHHCAHPPAAERQHGGGRPHLGRHLRGLRGRLGV
jgi:hypothetical protein